MAKLNRAVAMGFSVKSRHLYGLGGRAYDFKLDQTKYDDEYVMFNRDQQFEPGTRAPLYGSIPFIMGVDDKLAAGLAWVNSAWTFVKI